MRDIKFRAWNGKAMNYEPFSEYCHHAIEDGVFCDVKGPHGEFWTEPSKSILMQYTGLKDKNGKEIYEGDIVRWQGFAPDNAKYGMYQVLVCNDDCMAYYKFGSDYDYCASSESESVEVVGNIYENPELLDGNQ